MVLSSDLSQSHVLSEIVLFFKCRGNWKYLLCTTVSGISAGWFVWTSGNSSASQHVVGLHIYLLGAFIITNLIWILYSCAVSKVTESEISKVMKRDAVTYLPFLILWFFLIRNIINIDQYHSALTEYFLRVFLSIMSLGLVVFLKVCFLDVNIGEFKLYLTSGRNPRRLFPFSERKLLYVLMTVYFLIFVYVHAIQHNNFQSNSQIYSNILWNISHGNLKFTENDLDVPMHVFGFHFYPIWFLIAPFYRIFPSIYFLIFLQCAVVTIGALPIYWLAKEKLQSGIAGISFAIVYLLSTFIQTANIWAITGRTISVAFIAFAFYNLYKGNNIKFVIFTLLFLACGEAGAPIVFMLGLYILFIMKKRKMGMAISLLGLVYFLGAMRLAVYLNDGIYMYGGMRQDIFNRFLHLKEFVKFYITPPNLAIVFLLLLPVGYISILGMPVLLIAIPAVLMNLSSRSGSDITTSYGFAPLIPIILFAGIDGVKRIVGIKWFEHRTYNLLAALSCFVLVCAIGTYYYFNPFRYLSAYDVNRFKITERNRIAKELLDTIPSDASVSATISLRSYLGQRKILYPFPRGEVMDKVKAKMDVPNYSFPEVRDAEYVAVDVNDKFFDYGVNNPALQKLVSNPDYGVVAYRIGIVIFKRGSKQRLADIFCIDTPSIGNSQGLNFDNGIMLLGYNMTPKILKRGKILYITYFWRVLRDIQHNYRIASRFHKVDNRGADFEWFHQPCYGLYHTSRWREGDIIKDEVAIKMPSGFMPGTYKVSVKFHQEIKHTRPLPTKESKSLNSIQILHKF